MRLWDLKAEAQGINAGSRRLCGYTGMIRPVTGRLNLSVFFFLPPLDVSTINHELDLSEPQLGETLGRPKWVHRPGYCATVQRMDVRFPPVNDLEYVSRALV